MTFIRSILAVSFALSVAASTAAADPAPSKPIQPTDTKAYGDWTVRCYPVNSPSPCDMYEMLANKKTGQRVMSLSLAYMPSTDKHVIQIAVPLGVALARGATIESSAYTSPTMFYRRCDRGGCYVEMLFGNDAVTALSTAGSAKIRIYADGGKAFDIPFSLNGFGDAHGALVDLARKKTSPSKPAEAPAPAARAAAPAPAPSNPAPAATTP